MDELFAGKSFFNEPIGDWDVSRVTTMIGIFSGASAFNQDIGIPAQWPIWAICFLRLGPSIKLLGIGMWIGWPPWVKCLAVPRPSIRILGIGIWIRSLLVIFLVVIWRPTDALSLPIAWRSANSRWLPDRRAAGRSMGGSLGVLHRPMWPSRGCEAGGGHVFPYLGDGRQWNPQTPTNIPIGLAFLQ